MAGRGLTPHVLRYVLRNQDLTFWREQKTYEKIRRGKIRWLTFTNRFDNHKSICALSDKYHSDAKWLGKHNGIIHFRLNLIAAKAFISRRWRTILNHGLSCFFFRSRQDLKCPIWKNTVLNGWPWFMLVTTNKTHNCNSRSQVGRFKFLILSWRMAGGKNITQESLCFSSYAGSYGRWLGLQFWEVVDRRYTLNLYYTGWLAARGLEEPWF